jgi:hypothetical protein
MVGDLVSLVHLVHARSRCMDLGKPSDFKIWSKWSRWSIQFF